MFCVEILYAQLIRVYVNKTLSAHWPHHAIPVPHPQNHYKMHSAAAYEAEHRTLRKTNNQLHADRWRGAGLALTKTIEGNVRRMKTIAPLAA